VDQAVESLPSQARVLALTEGVTGTATTRVAATDKEDTKRLGFIGFKCREDARPQIRGERPALERVGRIKIEATGSGVNVVKGFM